MPRLGMRKWKHRLSNIDQEKRIGDCAECGPGTALRWRKAQERWVCRTSDSRTSHCSKIEAAHRKPRDSSRPRYAGGTGPEWRVNNPERYEEQKREARDRYRALREEALQHYGNSKCACCNEAENRFLTLDHLNNDGSKHRKEVGSGRKAGPSEVYRWLKANGYPPGYRVLCWNCNCGRAVNNGICPHQEART